MTDDRGRYLVNLHGLTHELFGGDPEEIVLRVAQVGDGSRTLGDLARALREEASRYERLQAGGWGLVGPFRDGVGRCRKTAEPGTPSSGATATTPAAPTTPTVPAGQPPNRLQRVVEGVDHLPEAAARLRAAADAYERLDAASRGLTEPVAGGEVPLD